MAGSQEWKEVMEMMGALQVQVEETRRGLPATKGDLEEAERRRVAEMREMRGQVEERERELIAVREELAEEKDEVMKLRVDLEISQSEGDTEEAWEAIKSASQKDDLNLAELRGLLDAMLAHVSRMTHLMGIALHSTSGFSAEGIKRLYRLTGLMTLDLTGTDVSDSALECIGSLVSLTFLALQGTNVTDAGLRHLPALSSLKVLWLSGCEGVTDDGMVHVGRLIRLESLGLRGTAVTDAGLRQLTALTRLTTLRAAGRG